MANDDIGLTIKRTLRRPAPSGSLGAENVTIKKPTENTQGIPMTLMITVADVRNSLSGSEGCARVFQLPRGEPNCITVDRARFSGNDVKIFATVEPDQAADSPRVNWGETSCSTNVRSSLGIETAFISTVVSLASRKLAYDDAQNDGRDIDFIP
jgi:hypothetical protein